MNLIWQFSVSFDFENWFYIAEPCQGHPYGTQSWTQRTWMH